MNLLAVIGQSESVLGKKPQILAIIGSVLFLVFVIELVRRRRLVERYALLWIAAAIILVIFAAWGGALEAVANALGIISPPNALFLIGLGTVFVLALHFSVAFSRLSEETKILAQEVARLDREQRRIRKGALGGEEDVAVGAVDPPATNGGSAGAQLPTFEHGTSRRTLLNFATPYARYAHVPLRPFSAAQGRNDLAVEGQQGRDLRRRPRHLRGRAVADWWQ